MRLVWFFFQRYVDAKPPIIGNNGKQKHTAKQFAGDFQPSKHLLHYHGKIRVIKPISYLSHKE